jgi:hypothetical protein
MTNESPHRAGQGATGAEDHAQQNQPTSSLRPTAIIWNDAFLCAAERR